MKIRVHINSHANIEIDPLKCLLAIENEWHVKTSDNEFGYLNDQGDWVMDIVKFHVTDVAAAELIRKATAEEINIRAAFKTLKMAFEKV